MSDSFDAAAHAAGEPTAVPAAPQETSAPQAAETVETQAEPTEAPATSEQDMDAPQEDAHATPSRAEKRIQQLLADRAQDRERLARLEGMLQRPQGNEQPAQQAPALPPDIAQYVGKEPDPNAFPAGEWDPGYLDARVDYKLRQREGNQELRRRHSVAQRQQSEFQSKLGSIVEAGAAKYADFADKALNHSVPMTQTMVAEIADSDAGADIAYFLGNNPAEARRIAALPANKVAREIGRIEERLTRTKDAPIPQPTKAPDPPRSVRGSNAGQNDVSRMSMTEYAAWSAKQFGGAV